MVERIADCEWVGAEWREEIVRCRDCANHGPREGFGCPVLGARSNGFCA